MEPLTARALARPFGAFLLGVVVGVAGTGVHRWQQPWGLVLALAAVVAAGVLVRAWTGWVGMLALALGVFGVVSLLGQSGPGGDVVVAAQPVGYAWYLGGLAVALAGLAPRRWFGEHGAAAVEPSATAGASPART
ncbi:DUF6113 family protein [Cellulomonas carbonis]|uniref:DUF6113 family protein n=1 Tax=Cellulomonas carbonis TaxID=1386092 RepID=UPI000A4ACD07|nr:DUF6113 family protein [Cellulomonas carbonis]